MATEQERIEEQRKKDAEAAEIAKAKQIAAEEEQAKLALAQDQAKPVSFELKKDTKDPSWQESWEQIYEAYRALDPANKNTENGAVMYFPSREAAKNFFKGFAEKGMSFLATEQGKDSHFYSCGTKTMFEGSFEQIHQQLVEAEKTAEGEDKEKIQQGIKDIAQFSKQDFKSKYKKEIQDPEKLKNEEPTAPSPFKRPGQI